MNPSLQDFSLVKTTLEKYQKDSGLTELSNNFYFLILNLVLGLQDDEVEESITDNHFLKCIKKQAGHDRGIDAIYIDSNEEIATIHFFNFKYIEKFENITNHFPATEIDKILSFLHSLMSRDKTLKTDINPVLYSKVEEIWEIFDKQNPNFEFHLCTNSYLGLEANEKQRFERGINEHSNFTIDYLLMNNIVSLLTRKGKQKVNAKVRAIGKMFFEKSDGDIRALIVNLDIKDLLRILLNNEQIRKDTELDDYKRIKKYQILEDAFEDNVRVYLKQRSKINRNIKKTALSNESHRFFYYNNGITITCDNFSYSKSLHSPIIELTNIQIVNGSQTIHALYEAFQENPERFEDMDILCRIYQTQNADLSTQIAEYTNSQNPVRSRDIRSIDFIQQKLEQEFLAKDMFYERKKNQYFQKSRSKRIDAEKTGQVLMSFYNELPSEAKNKKRVIFAELYDEIFDDTVNAEKVLLPYKLFEKIEQQKTPKSLKYYNPIKILIQTFIYHTLCIGFYIFLIK